MIIGPVLLVVVVGTTIWVGFDASKRDWRGGSGTATWVIGCILLWIIFFPYYLVRRREAPLKAGAGGAVTGAASYRECPFCKEAMRRDASICPHCRSSSTPWQFHDDHWWFRDSDDDEWQWFDEREGVWVSQEPALEPEPR